VGDTIRYCAGARSGLGSALLEFGRLQENRARTSSANPESSLDVALVALATLICEMTDDLKAVPGDLKAPPPEFRNESGSNAIG